MRNGDLIRWLGRVGAVVPLLMLGFVLVTLIVEAIPAIKFNGLGFLTGTAWSFGAGYAAPITTGGIVHQPGEVFGALPQIIGTLETSAIALIIAIPVSVGAALVIVERLPRRLASIIGGFLELFVEMHPPPPSVARSLRLSVGQSAAVGTVRFDDLAQDRPAALAITVLRPDLFRIVVESPAGFPPAELTAVSQVPGHAPCRTGNLDPKCLAPQPPQRSARRAAPAT